MSAARATWMATLALAATLVTAPALAYSGPPVDSPTPPAQPPTPTLSQLDASVLRFTNPGVLRFWAEGSVSTLATTEQSAGSTTITLATDILFRPDLWDVPENAREQIVDLVAQIPSGANVSVAGHTDSVVGAVDNQELSQHRADAVAAVIAAARPDLVLDVQGYGPTRPAVAEDPANPATYAANRRVEIVYQG